MVGKFDIYVDGGALNNQGADRHAYGSMAVFSNGAQVDFTLSGKTCKIARLDFGNKTNNQAEYAMVIVALSYLVDFYARNMFVPPTEIRTDSQLVVEQLTGRWKVKDEDLKVLNHTANELLDSLPPTVKIAWVPRDRIVTVLGH